MRTISASLSSVVRYSQSRYHGVPKLDKELADDYEKRTWRERLHCTDDGHVYIPPMAFKNAVAEAAKFLSIKIPGKANATWTKHFEAGLQVINPLVLPIKKEDVPGEWLFLNADGKRGGGTRVTRCMPYIPEWSGDVTFLVLDDTITKEAFDHHLTQAGQLIGIGRFRPRNNGYYGRFKVNKTVESKPE